MQKKQMKGFTLIELLAVIVILAIIALIAVPVIMNVITKARVSAFEDSAYGIVKAGELYYSNQLLEPEGMTKSEEFTVDGNVFKNSEGKTLDISGSIPSSGKVTVTSEGKVAIAISNGEYCIRKATTESSVKAEKLSDLGGTCNYKTVFTTASDGTEVPACITNNTECPAGTKVGVKVNDTDEPIDFYVMSDNTSKNEITLIMNKNLGGTVAWVSKEDYVAAGGTETDYGSYGNNNKGPLTALKALEDRTSSWTNIPLETYQVIDENNIYSPITKTARARLITKTEAVTLSNMSWAYDGFVENKHNGYWTSSAYEELAVYAYLIYYYNDNAHSCMYDYYVSTNNSFGIRPVITVSKTIL